MTPERISRLHQTLNKRQPDLTLITDQIHKPHNINAIIRTCDAVGIQTIHSVKAVGSFRHGRRNSAGSRRWIDVVRHNKIETPITQLQAKGFKIYAAHLSQSAIRYTDIDYTKPTAILMGAEKRGVSEEAAQAVDGHITIPMHGMVESYNVSVAAAIILQEAQRQREAKKMYASSVCPFDEQTCFETFFRWAHPYISRYCHEKNLDYPPLNEEGEIQNPAQWYKDVRAGIAPIRQWKL